MIKNNQKTTWIIDTVLFGGLICAFFMDETSLPFHQWLGAAVGILSNYHLIAHGRWVKAVLRRFFDKSFERERLYFMIDLLMAIGFTAILSTGIVMSTWLNLDLADYSVWKKFHVLSSIITLIVCLVKIGMHWKWVVKTTRKFRIKPTTANPQLESARIPVVSTEVAGRREFLKMMGIVCAASILAGMKAINELNNEKSANLSVSTVYEDTSQKQTISDSGNQSTSDIALSEPNNNTVSQSSDTNAIYDVENGFSVTCQALCQKSCSFPGHCRRYIDTNGNGRCDNGECI